MSIDILNMRQYEPNDQAINVALPVMAIECEAAPPMDTSLDAYEEAVLKLVSLGLSTNGVANALNATESLVDEILANLENKYYVSREIGKPWRLTEDGEGYLNGSIQERTSSESQFGFMFVNAIKKEVLPFFHVGDIGQISLFRGSTLPLKLTVEGDESNTFEAVEIKRIKLWNAYKTFFRNQATVQELDDGNITKEEAVDIFADLDSFDEEIEEIEVADENTAQQELQRKVYIRPLKKAPMKLYLRMRIIIDPKYPGGYRAESPFDLKGIDDNFFLRQMQWLEQSETAYLDGEVMQDFLYREIRKLSPSYNSSEKDFRVFVLERLPMLSQCRSRIPYIYEDMERIYSLIQRECSLLEKENIVNNLARSVVEGLFNTCFRAIEPSKLVQIQQKALDDVRTHGYVEYRKRICRNAHLNEGILQWVNERYLKTILGRLSHTYGNSIMEKFINMLVIEYHLSQPMIHRFLIQPNLSETYEMVDKLNRIRRKVSHDTDERFAIEDYNYYKAHVFDLINRLLESFREEM